MEARNPDPRQVGAPHHQGSTDLRPRPLLSQRVDKIVRDEAGAASANTKDQTTQGVQVTQRVACVFTARRTCPRS